MHHDPRIRRRLLACLLVIIIFLVIASQNKTAIHMPSSHKTPESLSERIRRTGKVACIIETRPLANLVPLILHFISVLGPNWPVVLATTPEGLPLHSAAFDRALTTGQVSVLPLPPDIILRSRDNVSAFMADPWLWHALAPAGHVLIFQADTVICANSEQRVDDFLQWDLIGAPISTALEGRHGYNGGFSLRNRTAVLDVLADQPWTSPDRAIEWEDQWFYARMKKLGFRLPDEAEAKRFAVETVWYDRPLGLHQVAKWLGQEMADKAREWCPEYYLATKQEIQL